MQIVNHFITLIEMEFSENQSYFHKHRIYIIITSFHHNAYECVIAQKHISTEYIHTRMCVTCMEAWNKYIESSWRYPHLM